MDPPLLLRRSQLGHINFWTPHASAHSHAGPCYQHRRTLRRVRNTPLLQQKLHSRRDSGIGCVVLIRASLSILLTVQAGEDNQLNHTCVCPLLRVTVRPAKENISPLPISLVISPFKFSLATVKPTPTNACSHLAQHHYLQDTVHRFCHRETYLACASIDAGRSIQRILSPYVYRYSLRNVTLSTMSHPSRHAHNLSTGEQSQSLIPNSQKTRRKPAESQHRMSVNVPQRPPHG